jgi:hypothetical protein
MPARLTACYGILLTGYCHLTALRTVCSSWNRQPPDFLILRSLPSMRILEKEHRHAGSLYPRY